MKKLKFRYKLLIAISVWFLYFFYTMYVGWETDRSYEPGLKPWIGRSFRIEEPMVLCCLHWYDGWYHELDFPHPIYLSPYTLNDFRRDPTKYDQSRFSSLHLLEPGTQFKIIQAFDWSSWGGSPLLIKATLKSGPHAGKKVIVQHLFDISRQEIILGPKKEVPISEL